MILNCQRAFDYLFGRPVARGQQERLWQSVRARLGGSEFLEMFRAKRVAGAKCREPSFSALGATYIGFPGSLPGILSPQIFIRTSS
jgi:hypothetical protein